MCTSWIVTIKGALYSFVDGNNEQLGHGSESEHSPRKVHGLRHVRISAAAAGDYRSLVHIEDGAVFSGGGDNGCGQLGRRLSEGSAPLFQRVALLSGIHIYYIASAGDASYAVAAAAAGELFTWDNGWVGYLGQVDTACQLALRIEALQGERVSAGNSHTIAVASDCGVSGWGWRQAEEVGLLTTLAVPRPRLCMMDSCASCRLAFSHLHLPCGVQPVRARARRRISGGLRSARSDVNAEKRQRTAMRQAVLICLSARVRRTWRTVCVFVGNGAVCLAG